MYHFHARPLTASPGSTFVSASLEGTQTLEFSQHLTKLSVDPLVLTLTIQS